MSSRGHITTGGTTSGMAEWQLKNYVQEKKMLLQQFQRITAE